MGYAKILIIDDMPDQITLLGNVLVGEGFRVFAATSGKSALRFLESHLPDIILCDLQISDTNGLNLLKKIKSEINKDLPIIILTSETDIEAVSDAFEAGANDYIKKPFSKAELLARIKTHLNLAFQRHELIVANNELNQFCTSVTHDLKAPFDIVNMLIGMLRAELGDAQPDSVYEIVNLISDKATNAKVMIERLFEFSKMCNVTPDVRRVNVKSIVEETFYELKSLVPERNIELQCDTLPFVSADEVLLRMAVKNLLQNAIKYSATRENAVIKVTSQRNPSFDVIKFSDNGVGFNMEYVDRIFKIFERLHSDTEFEGSGVGLALVNRIMQRHKGKIEACGEVDKGAEFTLYFPKTV